MLKDLSFLNSRRFWCLIGIAIIEVLSSEGILSIDIAQGIITILGGFTAIRTIDKIVTKK